MKNKQGIKNLIFIIFKAVFQAYIILFGVFVIIAAIFIIAVTVVNDNHTVDSEDYQNYSVELISKGAPFSFGPESGKVTLFGDESDKLFMKKSHIVICSADFILANDGVPMSEENWKVNWKDDCVEITITGDEQEDEIFEMYYNGDVKYKEVKDGE